jgi:hypothetical protein
MEKMPDTVVVVPEPETPPPVVVAEPPADLSALMRAMIESNQALTQNVATLSAELVLARDTAAQAREQAASAESAARVAVEIAGAAAEVATEAAAEVEEEDEEEEDEEGEENTTAEIPIVEIPPDAEPAAVVVETPAESAPEVRTEKRGRYFI